MMCCYLDLGQLWRCPVEWCAFWKGSVRECREHFNDKHSGSATLDFENVSRSFPPWTVPRDLWERALRPEVSGIAVDARLFHEAGRRLVHKYRVYKDPLPHPELREGVVAKLLPWPLLGSHTCGYQFHRRVLPWGKYRMTVFRKPTYRQLQLHLDG